ncbi:SDR family NAD(P)-dependent oxidoreductase [Tuwongella immobilis]|uniref:Ketoreductase domain-containing protein n=1 Tax=Tuwongella immobilis TaxID=692036 RepID=A0A6C2YU04_9BACT|nr:SDR family NAD(P)-dependent oxidoreductase [Tuwongella immobilis]VIP04395.1 kr domain protein : Putative short-chain dehydrogenase OS=Leptospirillum ferrodiazotrophum GN=UBAL3_80290048 PE=3 SV=1: adh_short [Tuwongella immobilis]VTS06152.1 kr domain protein : Putative short-chain dehydrogenase OS=Leptospirillum ferrodiazotrophum GN=UBAL3_80290048 PE=3 SV=1: adh_short [Tuwongella immobilis]
MQVRDRVVLLTGASSGLGWAMAVELAAKGAKLGLMARREPQLVQLQEQLRATGATVEIAVVDVGDRDAQHAAIAELTGKLGPVDLFIANAGQGAGTTIRPFNREVQQGILRTNLLGVIDGIEAVLPTMLERRFGQIVTIASLAGLRGLPGQEAYCASKAGLIAYSEGLRIRLRSHGINVTTICPGFVHTEMTQRLAWMPFAMSAPKAATKMLRAIERNAKQMRFPLPTALLTWASKWAPDWLVARVLRSMIVD